MALVIAMIAMGSVAVLLMLLGEKFNRRRLQDIGAALGFVWIVTMVVTAALVVFRVV